MPQRFALGSAAKAMLKSMGGLNTAVRADASTPTRSDLRAADQGIQLPADHYAHPGAPTEWWWHVGTLTAGPRIFGFEINAASYVGQGGFAFTQVMLTDVSNGRHFQRTTSYLQPSMFNCEVWAEHDPSKQWFVALGSPVNCLSGIEVTHPGSGYTSEPTVEIIGGRGRDASATAQLDSSGRIASIALWSGGEGYTSLPAVAISGGGGMGGSARAFHAYVAMNAPGANPIERMTVKALLTDEATPALVNFDLTLSQKGPPFLVLGSGTIPVPYTCGSPLQKNNYYYSLTRLETSGTIAVEGETFEVTGVTWMDHEYGAFAAAGRPVRWILQDIQLDNGISISNFTLDEPELDKVTISVATVQDPNGAAYWLLSTTTPVGRIWRSPVTGKSYFMELQVDIPEQAAHSWPGASIIVRSLIDSQEFSGAAAAIYEGVAIAFGVLGGRPVHGTGWNEQAPR